MATRLVGAVSGPPGVTAADAADSGPEPNAFTARTWKVYAVPFVRPVTTFVVAVAERPVTVLTTEPPELTTISWLVIGLPPSLAATVQLTVAWALAAVADTPLGADGGPRTSVWSWNFSRSTLVSVSFPSRTFCAGTVVPTAAPRGPVCSTVSFPPVPGVIV